MAPHTRAPAAAFKAPLIPLLQGPERAPSHLKPRGKARPPPRSPGHQTQSSLSPARVKGPSGHTGFQTRPSSTHPSSRDGAGLAAAEAVWPQGCCRPSGNTRALASLHRLQAWQPDHTTGREKRTSAAPQAHGCPPASPPTGGWATCSFREDPAGGRRKGGELSQDPVPSLQAPAWGDQGLPRPVPPLAGQRGQAPEGHALARHIPPGLPAPTATAANSSRKHILR